jgi:hypothetical protein
MYTLPSTSVTVTRHPLLPLQFFPWSISVEGYNLQEQAVEVYRHSKDEVSIGENELWMLL